MKLKALLFSIHRWLGIGMCLLFAMWFASGIVMMYVEYPELTREERLKNLPPLATESIRYAPADLPATPGIGREAIALTLTSVLGRPAYLIRSTAGEPKTFFADTGEALRSVNPEVALAAAQASGFAAPGAEPSYAGEVDYDQWTLTASLDVHRPLHKVSINDAAGTELYVSNRTGQIVRDTNRNERLWNWLGSTLHWIYPTVLRKNSALWVDVVVYLSLIGILSVITGGIIGFMRLRVRRPNPEVRRSPYIGWMKWHHVGGLFSLVFISTFIFSGLMSMGPWGVFASQNPAGLQIARYEGGRYLTLATLPLPDFVGSDGAIREVTWHQIEGEAVAVVVHADGSESASLASGPAPLDAKIRNAIPRLLPRAELIAVDVIEQPDNYYYSRHDRHRPLPVYRAKFNDGEHTWYHIDQNTGALVNRVTDASRRERWLFNGLHSLDIQFLLSRRPLWDLVVILLSLIGLGFSVTSVVIGWRRLVGK